MSFYVYGLVATLMSIFTRGISVTPWDYFWKERLLIRKVRMVLMLIVTGMICTSPRWKGSDSSLILPFYAK